MHIGNLIREVLDKKKIVHRRVADELNMSQQNFAGLLKRKSPDVATVIKIGQVINFDFLEIIHKENVQEFEGNTVQEPAPKYEARAAVNKVPVVVELDGTNETLNYWLSKLTAINSVL